MEKSSGQLCKILDMSFNSLNVMLARPELNKFRIGKYYTINYEFITNLYNILELKKKNTYPRYEQKLKKAQNKLYKLKQSLDKIKNRGSNVDND